MGDLEHSPLTDEDFQKIKDGLAQLDKAEAQLRLAQRAGFDMSDNQKQIDTARNQLLQIKQVYFPGRA